MSIPDPVAGIVFSHRYLEHNPGFLRIDSPNNPRDPFVEPELYPSNHRLVMRAQQLIDLQGVGDHLAEISPRPATDEQLLAYHTPNYLARLTELDAQGGGESGDGAMMGPGTLGIARLAAGGVIAAVDAVMTGPTRRVFANVRPPGHHAVAERGMGFCVFGNVALAALHARQQYGLERILILDWDVHHGNGTQAAFFGDPGVLLISVHQEDLYPAGSGNAGDIGTGDGRGMTVNVPLPGGCGDAAYRAAFDRIIGPIVESYGPELIVVSAGQDASARDALGRMSLVMDSYRWLTRFAMDAAERSASGRLVVAQEGGYSDGYAPYCTFAIVEVLAGVETTLTDPLAARRLLERVPGRVVSTSAREALAAVRSAQAPYWPELRGA